MDEYLEGTERVETVVVVGKDYDRDGRVGLVVHTLDADGERTGAYHFYLASKFKGHVGNIYTYTTTPDGKAYYPRSVTWAGHWPNSIERTEWNAKARAFDAAESARKLATSEEKRNLIEEAMAPLRNAYLTTNNQGRLALKALVLHYLEHGRVDL